MFRCDQVSHCQVQNPTIPADHSGLTLDNKRNLKIKLAVSDNKLEIAFSAWKVLPWRVSVLKVCHF